MAASNLFQSLYVWIRIHFKEADQKTSTKCYMLPFLEFHKILMEKEEEIDRRKNILTILKIILEKKKLINNLKRLRPSWVELPTKKKNDLKNKLSYCNLQHLKKYSKRGQGSEKAIALRMMMKLFKLTLIIIKTFCGYLIKSYYYFFILF